MRIEKICKLNELGENAVVEFLNRVLRNPANFLVKQRHIRQAEIYGIKGNVTIQVSRLYTKSGENESFYFSESMYEIKEVKIYQLSDCLIGNPEFEEFHSVL